MRFLIILILNFTKFQTNVATTILFEVSTKNPTEVRSNFFQQFGNPAAVCGLQLYKKFRVQYSVLATMQAATDNHEQNTASVETNSVMA